MLPWWGWLLSWTVLVGGSGLWLGLLARGLWGRGRALGAEVSRVGELLTALESRADEARDVEPPPLAVTQPPHRLWEDRRRQRAQQVADRRVRRARRLPPWARVD